MDAEAYFLGASKKDVDNHWAQIVGKMNNFKKGRDKVQVTFSNTNKNELIILLNDANVYNSILPGPIIENSENVSYQRGNKAKIVIKLKKERPGTWVDKWSPTRNEACPSLGSSAGTESLSSDSHISLPKMF